MSLLSPLLAFLPLYIHSELSPTLRKQQHTSLPPHHVPVLAISSHSFSSQPGSLPTTYCLHHYTEISHNQASNNFHIITFWGTVFIPLPSLQCLAPYALPPWTLDPRVCDVKLSCFSGHSCSSPISPADFFNICAPWLHLWNLCLFTLSLSCP